MLIFTGFLFMILSVAFVGALCGMLIFLIDMPSILLVLVSLLFFLYASRSGRVIREYIKCSFKKNYEYTRAELEAIVTATKNINKFMLATGGFGFMAGLIISLASISMPNQLAPSLAVSLITLMYAIAIAFFVFFPVQAWAEGELNRLG